MLTSILVGLVTMGTVANLVVFARYLQVLNTAQQLQITAQRLQAQANVVNRNVALGRNMAAEAIEFGRKNPAMESLMRQFTPLLQQLDLAPAPVPAPAPNAR